MTNVLARVGDRLKQIRQEQHLTQEQLAEASGLSSKFVGEVERGAGNPTVRTLDALAHALSVDISDLLQPANAMRAASSHDVMLAREALQSLDAFIQRAAPNPEVKYKLRRRRSPSRS